MTTLGFRTSPLSLVACGFLLTACGATSPAPSAPSTAPEASTSTGTTSSSATPSTGEHSGVSKGEAADLVAELVPVPGFTYTDVPSEERDRELAGVPKSVSAASFHAVTNAASGREVAFLALYVDAPTDAMHSESYALRVAQSNLNNDNPTATDYSGQKVWYAEDPSRPASRYKYTWDRHGTFGWVDGANRKDVEQFLAAYFAVPFQGAEPARLSERMVLVPGFTYTNAVDQAKVKSAAEQNFPGSAVVLHYLFDRTHMFAGLNLVGPVSGVTDDQVVEKVAATFAQAYGLSTSVLQRGPDQAIGPATVHRLIYKGGKYDILLWRWSDTDVVGWIETERMDLAEQFIKVFVTASPAR
jgi:hypothetical protein